MHLNLIESHVSTMRICFQTVEQFSLNEELTVNYAACLVKIKDLNLNFVETRGAANR